IRFFPNISMYITPLPCCKILPHYTDFSKKSQAYCDKKRHICQLAAAPPACKISQKSRKNHASPPWQI
ncbi:MAG: hypothetical protein IKA46_04290, partial [Clostridia bacterium]|nr:hypothetical protein [Clostridia bacterium]